MDLYKNKNLFSLPKVIKQMVYDLVNQIVITIRKTHKLTNKTKNDNSKQDIFKVSNTLISILIINNLNIKN